MASVQTLTTIIELLSKRYKFDKEDAIAFLAKEKLLPKRFIMKEKVTPAFSSTNTKIKARVNANDIFITPLKLSKTAITMIDCSSTDIWYDPFRNNGSYYNQFPMENTKLWSEILEEKDFFSFNEQCDIICSNPPYSILDRVIEKSIELRPRVINYLLGVGNLTCKRIEAFENAGYGLVKLHMCKVYTWFGMSAIVQFELNKESIISFDRVVWR